MPMISGSQEWHTTGLHKRKQEQTPRLELSLIPPNLSLALTFTSSSNTGSTATHLRTAHIHGETRNNPRLTWKTPPSKLSRAGFPGD